MPPDLPARDEQIRTGVVAVSPEYPAMVDGLIAPLPQPIDGQVLGVRVESP
jgi:hypothetical protein